MLKSDADQAVFVGTHQGVYKVPFQHCRDYNTTCPNCVGDPYCSWENGVCLHLRKGLQDAANICPPDDKIIIHNCPSRQVSYVRRLNVPNHPLNLFVMAEAAKEDNVSIMGNEIRCPPCGSLPYTESRSVSSGREFLVLHINGSSTERESCLCSVVLEVECGETKAINFTITVDDSPQLNLNQECLDKLSNYDRDISQYKFGLNSWIRKQANSCGVEDLQTCKRHP
ncbi:semaphorin-2A-like [Acanthaster planci]|uniref:Semaphorin-2A-like n=1 Tax=Acanthaster planci TaxID=133434 RepID=A0A8B8A0C9_ACAPL|nr:semaphorin-2A-like [Acanthaster planci]